MSWRNRLRVSPSKAEIDVLLGLEDRGLTRGMFRNVEICLQKTTPDYLWKEGFVRKGLPVYLDGPPHEKERQRLKDELIDEMLCKMGLHPLRIPYKSPLSDRRLNEILDLIEETLRLLEYRFAGRFEG